MACRVELNIFLSKGSNVMMQCVTCNKLSLFAPKHGEKKILDFLQRQDTNSYTKVIQWNIAKHGLCLLELFQNINSNVA
jgi:hypothetical protein